jgi:RNA polymerase sigma factor (sigma-70 family)
MSARADVWEDAIRRYDRNVYLSVRALGLAPERAREIAQAAWTRLIEQHGHGALRSLELPGLAIRQARFLGLNELARARTERRVLAEVPARATAMDIERQVHSRAQMAKVIEALRSCSPTARKVFGLVYGTPGTSPSEVATVLGLSIQRVRQILSETRTRVRNVIGEDLP